MSDSKVWPRSHAHQRGAQAAELLARAFQENGWFVSRQPPSRQGYRPDLLVRRKAQSYAVELKVGVEGRRDRLIPLWSQAYLQAARAAGGPAPLPVVAAPRIAPRVAQHILEFVEKNVPEAAAGVIDFEGLRQFRGPGLESLNSLAPSKPRLKASARRGQVHLFSDLNQWMLKVLLAPELPPQLISAPRGHYQNASQLAKAANVSVMSASRLLQQLQHHGYLHESASYLKLVRRDDLFRRWQGSALQSIREVPMRFLLRGMQFREALQSMMSNNHACLALYAAAEALGLGIIEGVPPHVYVQRLSPIDLARSEHLVAVGPGEAPDMILRQASAPRSIFGGLVQVDGLPSCDVLQVWIDVVGHPSRGREQADFIRQRALEPLFRGDERG